MSVAAMVGREPEHRVTWEDLTARYGVPEGLYGVAGLYAVSKGGNLLYVGQSDNLSRRIGQAIGALCGGGDLHPIYRLWVAWDELPAGDLVFDIWAGDDAYNAEPSIIAELNPPYNRRGRTA